MKTICHLTSVHRRYDPRIFLKQCTSLAKEYNTYLIVADGLGDEEKNGVKILDVGPKSKYKINRMLHTTYKVYKAAKNINASVYEFHDPELLLHGLLLKSKENKVIFDMHEDTANQIMVREWIPLSLKKLTAYIYTFFERFVLRRLDAIFVPQEFMRKKFLNLNSTFLISNYLLDDFYPEINLKSKVTDLLYVGTVTLPRGIMNMLNMLEKVNVRLTLVGPFTDLKLEKLVKKHPAWGKVDYLGILTHEEVKNLYLGNYIGLIPFSNAGQYGYPYVIKLFEYMAFGLPMIMPKHGEWVNFNNNFHVGINVNTEDSNDFSQAVNQLFEQDVSQYSENGMKAVKNSFLWSAVEAKLLNSYESIINE